MSEENTAAQPAEAAASTQKTEQRPAAVEVTIPQEVLDGIRKDAEKTAREAAQRTVAATNQRLITAITGEDPKPDPRTEQFLEKFVTDPAMVLAAHTKLVKEETKREIEEERTRVESQQREFNKAYKDVLWPRPDIRTNEQAHRIFDAFYEQADDSLDEKGRIEWAAKEYDLLMEKSGAGKAEDRIKAASPSPGASGGHAGSDGPQKSYRERAGELAAQDLQARRDAYKAKHGGRMPARH